MAELIVDELVQTKNTIHKISCDKCRAFICDSIETSDGWYYDPSEYEQKIFINNTWYYLRGQLCESCKEKTTAALVDALVNFGFKIQ